MESLNGKEILIRDLEAAVNSYGNHSELLKRAIHWIRHGTPPPTLLECNGLVYNKDSAKVSVNGKILQVRWTRKELIVLEVLLGRPGYVYSREHLMNTIWPNVDLTSDRVIDVYIRRIRSKLGEFAHRLETIRGFGYTIKRD